MSRRIKWNEKADYEKLEPGDIIEVSVGGKIYESEITENKVQRFRPIGDHYEKHKRGEYDLNQLCIDYHNGKMTQREYLELNIGIGYSVAGLCDFHQFHDMQIINPIWDYAQPENVYLFACYEKDKMTQEDVIKAIQKRDSCSLEEAQQQWDEHFDY